MPTGKKGKINIEATRLNAEQKDPDTPTIQITTSIHAETRRHGNSKEKRIADLVELRDNDFPRPLVRHRGKKLPERGVGRTNKIE